MANVFAILTAIVLAISAFLAFQNKGDREDPGRGYAGWINKKEKMEGEFSRTSKELANLQEDLDDAKGELSGLNTENTKNGELVTTAEKENDDLEKQVESAEDEATSKAAEVETRRKDIEKYGDIDEVIALLKELQSDIAGLDLEIADLETKRVNLESSRTGVQKSLDDVSRRIQWRNIGKSNPDLATTVNNYYPNLGFVTLGGGDNLGIVKTSILEVVRDGTVIAQLQVTTVQAKTAAADIVPGSVAEGESVRAGDSVRAQHTAVAPPEGNPGAGTSGVPPLEATDPVGDPLEDPEPVGEGDPEPVGEEDPFGEDADPPESSDPEPAEEEEDPFAN